MSPWRTTRKHLKHLPLFWPEACSAYVSSKLCDFLQTLTVEKYILTAFLPNPFPGIFPCCRAISHIQMLSFDSNSNLLPEFVVLASRSRQTCLSSFLGNSLYLKNICRLWYIAVDELYSLPKERELNLHTLTPCHIFSWPKCWPPDKTK